MLNLIAWLNRYLDPLLFSKQRADYFYYLHAVLSGSAGRLTIRELFLRDSIRYGLGTVRGRLSATWAKLCELSGGDLYAIWLGYFPLDELILVRISQGLGNQRLLSCFAALTGHLVLLKQAKQILWSTLATALIAIILVFLILLAVPWWTTPSLQQTFAGIPEAYFGKWSSSLFIFANLLKNWGWLLPVLLLVLTIAFLYSLPNSTGRLRTYLDGFGIWRLYRQINALRFLSLLTILLQPGLSSSQQLLPIIASFQEGARPWFSSHLQLITLNINQGIAGPESFDTGLLDRDLYWYLTDMASANGLQGGLLAVQQRMQGNWLLSIHRQAVALRWLCLLFGVACVLGIGLWHYAAIDDLRRAWMMFNASSW